MAVADQIGIPVENARDAAATGTASGYEEGEQSLSGGMDDKISDEGTDR